MNCELLVGWWYAGFCLVVSQRAWLFRFQPRFTISTEIKSRSKTKESSPHLTEAEHTNLLCQGCTFLPARGHDRGAWFVRTGTPSLPFSSSSCQPRSHLQAGIVGDVDTRGESETSYFSFLLCVCLSPIVTFQRSRPTTAAKATATASNNVH